MVDRFGPSFRPKQKVLAIWAQHTRNSMGTLSSGVESLGRRLVVLGERGNSIYLSEILDFFDLTQKNLQFR